MLDMIRPATLNKITLQDLKRCKMTPVFFDTFFNLEKYLDHEQRDPFATQREVDEDGNEVQSHEHFFLCKYFKSPLVRIKYFLFPAVGLGQVRGGRVRAAGGGGGEQRADGRDVS